MRIAFFPALSALLLSACATDTTGEATIPLEAPNVQFRTAVVIAAADTEERIEVEDLVVSELLRRRPNTKLIASHRPFPDLMGLSRKRFQAYLTNQNVDVVITIVPFEEVVAASFDEWSDVADGELKGYLRELESHAIVGNFGVQMVAWDSRTWEPLYARTSELMVGQISGPAGVADFAVLSISRTTGE